MLIRVSDRWGKKCFSEFEQQQIRSLRGRLKLDEQEVSTRELTTEPHLPQKCRVCCLTTLQEPEDLTARCFGLGAQLLAHPGGHGTVTEREGMGLGHVLPNLGITGNPPRLVEPGVELLSHRYREPTDFARGLVNRPQRCQPPASSSVTHARTVCRWTAQSWATARREGACLLASRYKALSRWRFFASGSARRRLCKTVEASVMVGSALFLVPQSPVRLMDKCQQKTVEFLRLQSTSALSSLRIRVVLVIPASKTRMLEHGYPKIND